MTTDIKSIGEYLLLDAIGEGAFGTVYLGKNIFNDQLVAVKEIEINKLSTKRDKKKLKREIEILKRLDHPNIVNLLGVHDLKNGGSYLIFDYVERGELFDFIRQNGRLSEDIARKFARDIISALEYCHSLLIIHRDLKPENVLLDSDLNIKIVDFGLANMIKPGKRFTTFCGSLHYASPEILNGDPYLGPAVDVWSLGIICYTMVVGRQPWFVKTPDELLTAIEEEGLVIPREISDECVDLIVQMLHPLEAERITIPELRIHPWILEGYDEPPPSYLPDTQITRIDPRIIRQLEKIGFTNANTPEMHEEILSNGNTQICATYQLLANKRIKKKSKKRRIRKNTKIDGEVVSRRRSRTIGGDDIFFDPSHRRSNTVGSGDRGAVLDMIRHKNSQKNSKKGPKISVDHDTTARPMVDNIDALTKFTKSGNSNRLGTPKKKRGVSPSKSRPRITDHFTNSNEEKPLARETSTIELETGMSRRSIKKELRRVFALMGIDANYVDHAYDCYIEIEDELIVFKVEIEVREDMKCVHIHRLEGSSHLYGNVLHIFTSYLKL